MVKLKLRITLCLLSIVFASCNTKPKVQSNQHEVEAVQKDHTKIDRAMVFQAAFNGDVEVVKDALQNGFAPNIVDEDNRTAIMLAAYNGHSAVVKLLIDEGADVNFTDSINRTALMYGSSGPFTETILALLQAGAKPNLVEKEENWTAAMMAASEGQLEVLKILVAHGADLTMVDVDGESSLDFARSKGHSAVADYIKTQLKQ